MVPKVMTRSSGVTGGRELGLVRQRFGPPAWVSSVVLPGRVAGVSASACGGCEGFGSLAAGHTDTPEAGGPIQTPDPQLPSREVCGRHLPLRALVYPPAAWRLPGSVSGTEHRAHAGRFSHPRLLPLYTVLRSRK